MEKLNVRVEIQVKCGSCLRKLRSYPVGHDGFVPLREKYYPIKCPGCGALLSGHDIDIKIRNSWEALVAWKEKNEPKKSWDKMSPLHITTRVKPMHDLNYFERTRYVL